MKCNHQENKKICTLWDGDIMWNGVSKDGVCSCTDVKNPSEMCSLYESKISGEFWINFILKRTDKYTKETKIWHSPVSSSMNTIDAARNEIELMRKLKDQEVVSAWIDIYDNENNKTTVFHDCYINFVGNIEK